MDTFCRFKGVRRAMLGHISGPRWRKIQRACTKDVRPAFAKTFKSLI